MMTNCETCRGREYVHAPSCVSHSAWDVPGACDCDLPECPDCEPSAECEDDEGGEWWPSG